MTRFNGKSHVKILTTSLLLAGYPKAAAANNNVNRHDSNLNRVSFILEWTYVKLKGKDNPFRFASFPDWRLRPDYFLNLFYQSSAEQLKYRKLIQIPSRSYVTLRCKAFTSLPNCVKSFYPDFVNASDRSSTVGSLNHVRAVQFKRDGMRKDILSRDSQDTGKTHFFVCPNVLRTTGFQQESRHDLI